MNHFAKTGILTLLIFICSLSVQSRAEVYLAHDPAWAGCWIWGPVKNVPSAKIDLGDWLAVNPGGWGNALVYRILGNAASVGIRDIYWQMQDNRGRLLYPSAHTEKVLKWSNWGVDFNKTDMPAIAIRIAKQLHMNIKLVAPDSFLQEIRQRYPNVEIVGINTVPADAICGTDITRENLGKFGKYQNPNAQYFRKTFDVSVPVKSAELCITAMQTYRVFLDGKLIGTDSTWQDGETYNITNRLTPGKHVLAVEVKGLEKPSWEVGLIVNLRWTDKDGHSHILATDTSWRRTEKAVKEWNQPNFDDSRWENSTVVAIEGTGDRFLRLNEPWKNPRPLLSDENCSDMLITGIKIIAQENPEKISALVDGGISDTHSPRWTCRNLPAIITFTFSQKELVGGMRIYSGWLRYDYSPAGPGEIKKFKLQALVDKKWIDLCDVQNAKPYLREIPFTNFYFEAFFTPVECEQVRLIIMESYDTGQRLNNSGGTPLPVSQRWFNLREIELLRVKDSTAFRK